MTKHQDSTPWISWPDALALAELYKDGVAAWTIYHEHNPYRHSYERIKAYFQHLGIWRDTSAAQQLRRKRERRVAEIEAIAHAPSRGLREFRPMLTVSVAEGVLLDRMDEALEPTTGSSYGGVTDAP